MAGDIATAGPVCSASQRRVQLAVTAVACAWFAVAPAPAIDGRQPAPAIDGRQYFERFTPAALQMEPWETKVRDRAYLAGSSNPAFPASVEGSDGSFPAFFRADADLAATADPGRGEPIPLPPCLPASLPPFQPLSLPPAPRSCTLYLPRPPQPTFFFPLSNCVAAPGEALCVASTATHSSHPIATVTNGIRPPLPPPIRHPPPRKRTEHLETSSGPM